MNPIQVVNEEPGRLLSLAGNFDAADLCLLGALTGRSGVIQSRQNGSKGLLALEEGALVHASTGDLQGLAAFKRMLSWRDLEFSWTSAESDSQPQPNVRLNTGWLLKIAGWRQHPPAEAGPHRASGILTEVHLEDLFRLLEQKRESGTLTVTAEGLCGIVVFREGQIIEADSGETHGVPAIREIRSWTPVQVIYSVEAGSPAVPDASAAAGPDGLEDLAKLLDELAGEVPDILAAGIVRISDEQLLVESARDPLFPGSISSYSAVVKSHQMVAELMGGGACGNTEDLLITLEKAYILIRMLGSAHFQGLIVPRPGNPALTRLVMQRFEPLLLEALERAAP